MCLALSLFTFALVWYHYWIPFFPRPSLALFFLHWRSSLSLSSTLLTVIYIFFFFWYSKLSIVIHVALCKPHSPFVHLWSRQVEVVTVWLVLVKGVTGRKNWRHGCQPHAFLPQPRRLALSAGSSSVPPAAPPLGSLLTVAWSVCLPLACVLLYICKNTSQWVD